MSSSLTKHMSSYGVAIAIGSFSIVAFCLTWLAPQRASAQASGLVAAYSFDEGAGTTVTDLSGNGNTGTIIGAVWTTAGKFNKALSFDGVSSYVDLGNAPSLQLTGSMTWSAWINTAANSTVDGQIIAKSDGGPGWQLKTSPDTGARQFGAAVSGNSSSRTQRYSKTVPALNTWYHVAGVYNASASTLDVYVNGVLDDGILVGTVPAFQLNSSVNANIGRRTGGFYFNGVIDEVRIYNRALAQSEIQAEMNTPLGVGVSDTQAPTTPATLTAAAASATQINLSWTASTDNVAVTGYRVERCQGVGCVTFAQIAAPTGIGTTYSNTALTTGTSYSYRVRATDAAGNLSGYSPIATATTPDTQAPTAPGTLTAAAVSTSQINLSWAASTDNLAVTGYRVERCQGVGCVTFAQIAAPTGIGTTYSDTALTAGTSYSYRVRATDAAGNLSPYSNTASATTTATISGLVGAYSFNAGTGTSVADASGNSNTGTIVGASWTAGGKYGSALSFNGSSSYIDLGNPAVLGLTGSMTVSAWINAAANPPNDGIIIAKSDSTSGWQLKTSADTGVRQFGVAVSGNSSSRTQRYSKTVPALNTWYHVAGVYNASASTLDVYVNGVLDSGVLVGTVPASQLNSSVNVNIGRRTGGYYFNGVIDEVHVYNRALAQSEIQADMNTPLGVVVSDTQAPTAPGTLTAAAASTSQINLSWAASTDNVAVTGYRVERCQGAACSTFAQIAAPAGTGTTYSDTALTAGTSYSYRVRATDAAGNLSGYSPIANATTQSAADTQTATAPGTLTATAASSSQINLSWAASTDNVAVTGYRVERCQGAGCATFAQIAAPAGTGTTYIDTALTAGTSYSYRVRATDAAGNLSPYSNTASATTTAATISGLVGAYSFNEGTGTSVADASGNSNTGTIVGASWTAGGKYGSALSFDGSSSYIDLGNPAALGMTGSMTVSAWINAASNPPDDGIIVAKSDGALGWQFKTSPDTGPETFGLAVSSSDGSLIQRYSTTVRSLNTWYYVAGVYNASAGTLSIYVNGVLDNGVLIGTVPASQANSSVNVNIGRRGGGYYFNGVIDEVRIYNRALAQSEIQADMNTPIGSGVSNPPPAVTLSSSSLAFGNQATGTASVAKSTTLTNTGGASLTIASIAVSGANSSDFAQSNNCGASLAPSGSCTISVVFTPAATGARSATVTIADNASGSPHTIGLTGTGILAGTLSVSPRVSTLTFTRTQQFNALNNNGIVSWLVDGVAGGSAASGTISTAGLYSPPGSTGSHTVTALDQSQSVNATVYVTNYPGTFTRDVDNLRTGLNSNETVLTPANVNAAQFGKLFSYALDGVADASPLYVANLSIPGQGFHNVVYVATEHDSVYAFDADGLSSNPLWKVSFINPASGITTVPPSDTGECCDISPEIGITGSPVIDRSTGTLYVVAKTKEVSGGSTNYVHRFHALDITTGAEKFGGPVVIQASVPGSGDGASGGQVPFISLRENQRAALLLSNGVVYFAFAAHGDKPPYHGWVLGYNAATLRQVMVYNSTPNGSGGGIWQSGDGLATDSTGNIYFVTGNGDFNANSGGSSYGDSFVKLSPSGAVLDSFTPHDQANMQANDLDLGSGGTLLLPDQSGPHPHLAISAGKNGTIYLVDRDNMGRYNASNDNQIVQSLVNVFPNGTFITGNFKAPLYFNGSVYFSADVDNIKSFKVINGLLSTSPTSQTSLIPGYPGATLSMSANGSSGGILWAIQRIDFGPTGGGGPQAPGVLHAYDATNLGNELYNSNQAAGSRDALDFAAKWSAALVANGKVFVATNARLTGFSLLP